MTTNPDWLERAQRAMPGGVNSPVRAFGAVGGTPVQAEKGAGAFVRTDDGRDLLDFCCSWGALILGHAHPAVVDAVCRAARNGTSFGIHTRGETELAELLCDRAPYIEMVRLVNSGTEAVMTALRLARGATGRRKILKFDGCYHGHSDGLLVSAGSGVLTGGRASSAGVSPAAAAETLVAPYNDGESVSRIAERNGAELAAIIVEPIAANMGLVQPEPDFLAELRRTADRCGALLIFDEVITGFRLAPAPFGTLCGVAPDLTCLGKIVGGGLPVGALAGPADLMRRLAPTGDVYQAGTLSGNPLTVAAGLATLRTLVAENPYPSLERLGRRLGEGVNRRAQAAGAGLHAAFRGSMFTVFHAPPPIACLADARQCDTRAYASLFRAMLECGVYLPPSQFETAFLSAAHTERDVETFLDGVDAFLDRNTRNR